MNIVISINPSIQSFINLFFQMTYHHHHYFIIPIHVNIQIMLRGAVPWSEKLEQCLTQVCVNSFAAMNLLLSAFKHAFWCQEREVRRSNRPTVLHCHAPLSSRLKIQVFYFYFQLANPSPKSYGLLITFSLMLDYPRIVLLLIEIEILLSSCWNGVPFPF